MKSDRKKGLSAVRKRIAAAFKNPKEIEIRPDFCIINGVHRISFTISSEYGYIKGECAIKV